MSKVNFKEKIKSIFQSKKRKEAKIESLIEQKEDKKIIKKEFDPNLKFDDNGVPMSTAQGNMADIFCDYEEYGLTVEVTTASGQKQYEMESEPVSRHLAKYKKETGKDAYCLFIAPKINEACIAHFFMLHKMNIAFYGGKSVIVPIDINTFRKMLTDSYKVDYQPNPKQVKSLFEYSLEIAEKSDNEVEWYTKVTEKALNWLTV